MVDIPAIFLGMPVTRKGIRRPSGNAYFRIATIRPEASRLSGKSCVAYNCSQHGTYLRLIENLRENLSVERLAKRMGMSSRNFTRVCLRETRMNPGQFVDRMRVEAAQQMIDSSAMGLKEIADACGFQTPLAMRRTFLRVLGITAGEYASRFKRSQSQTEMDR